MYRLIMSNNVILSNKGNLTKHMKSKAHLKKCLELGVSPMNMDNTDVAGKSFMANKISFILLLFHCLRLFKCMNNLLL